MTTAPLPYCTADLTPVPLETGIDGCCWPVVGPVLTRAERTFIKNAVVGMIQEQSTVLSMLAIRGDVDEATVVALLGDNGYFGPERSSQRVVEILSTLVQRHIGRSTRVIREVVDCCRRFQWCGSLELSPITQETFKQVDEKMTNRWMTILPQNG